MTVTGTLLSDCRTEPKRQERDYSLSPFSHFSRFQFSDAKNSLRNSRTLAIKSRVFHWFSTFAASVHLLQYCYWPGLRHHHSQRNSEFLFPLNSPRRLCVAFVLPSVSIAACCSSLYALLPLFLFYFFCHFYEMFFFTCAPSPVLNRAVFGNVRVGFYVPQNTR